MMTMPTTGRMTILDLPLDQVLRLLHETEVTRSIPIELPIPSFLNSHD